MWDVIKALRSHDDELGEQLDELRRQIGRRGQRPRLPSKIHLDLPVRVGIDFARAFDARLVDETTTSWEFWFGLLERFVEDNGHACVPRSYTADGYRLGDWVISQRAAHTRGSLDVDRQRRLEELPGWTWDTRADQWEEGFRRLLDYVKRHGHARPLASYKVDDYQLGKWVSKQREKRDEGRLDADRERRLEELPGWTWDPRADQWEEGFSRLLDYVKRHRHARVTRDYKVDGYQLGWWVSTQRYSHAGGSLEADREHRLEGLPGWTWDRHADQWEEGFSRLHHYIEGHGDALVPYSYSIDGYKLGMWVRNQRTNYAKGTLDVDRRRRLQELPGWTWDARADQWEEGFRLLHHYVERYGDACPPASYKVDGYRLGGWVTKQRNKHDEGSLEADHERRLEGLPGWTWDPFADMWEEGFSRLRHYVERHGGSRVPRSYTVDGYKLGDWVINQRAAHTRGSLGADRQRRLESVPGWTWDTHADQWEEGFSRLLDYVERHGHARVPSSYKVDGHRLGQWVANQRHTHAKGTLDADREHRLEELPGWTWGARAATWEENFSRLLDYVKRHSDARVPSSYKVDGYRLGAWVVKQRARRAEGTLYPDRQQRLQELPGWTWNTRSST